MHFGAAMFMTDYSMTPVAFARALEERGFESFWCPEHSHIPLSRASEWPQGGELPKKYYDVMDPFVSLSAAAAVTTDLKLATGICLVIQRDPIQTAKSVASLDTISNGRFLFGVGSGWNADEMANHGTEFKSRHKVLRERIEAMKVIWSESKAEYHGDYVDFDPMMTWPKTVQQPGPPILVGGEFPYAARRALEFGDGWLPHGTRPGYTVLDILPRFRQMEAEYGREPGSTPLTVFGAEEDEAKLAALKETGVDRVVVSLASAKEDEILPILDRWAALNEKYGD